MGTLPYLLSVSRLLAENAPGYTYNRPFVQPIPLWDHWYLWLLPLCAAVAIVYKSVRCDSMRKVPREATSIFVMIVGGLILCAVLLSGLSYWF